MTFKALHRWTNEGEILSTTVLAFPKRVNCPPHAPSTRRLTLLPSIETWVLLGALRSFLDHSLHADPHTAPWKKAHDPQPLRRLPPSCVFGPIVPSGIEREDARQEKDAVMTFMPHHANRVLPGPRL